MKNEKEIPNSCSFLIGPTQVKCRLLISSIFDAKNFQHILEMLRIMLQHFRKMLEIHCIKNARN